MFKILIYVMHACKLRHILSYGPITCVFASQQKDFFSSNFKIQIIISSISLIYNFIEI